MANFTTDEIGNIIVKAGLIESALRANGGTGNGLRELSESLGSKITPPVQDLLNYIGMIRNFAAHEGINADVDDWDVAFFEEICSVIMAQLAPKNKVLAPPPVDVPKKTIPKIEVEEYYEVEEEEEFIGDSIFWKRIVCIPGFHILYPFKLLLDSFTNSSWALFGIFCYSLLGILLYYTLNIPIYQGLISVFLLLIVATLSSICSCEDNFLPKIWYACPILNVLALSVELLRKVHYTKLLGAVTLLAIPWISLYELIYKNNEMIAGIILLIVGYITGIIIRFLTK